MPVRRRTGSPTTRCAPTRPTCSTEARRAARTCHRAHAELAVQLDVIAAATDRLAAAVPDVDVRRAEDLTEELRRRHGNPS